MWLQWCIYTYILILIINNNVITDFPADDNNSNSFKFKKIITGQTNNDGIKDVKIMVPLKNPSNFWRTLDMSLINCEIILMLTWSKNCLLIAGNVENQNPTFTVTNTKLKCSYCKSINTR